MASTELNTASLVKAKASLRLRPGRVKLARKSRMQVLDSHGEGSEHWPVVRMHFQVCVTEGVGWWLLS